MSNQGVEPAYAGMYRPATGDQSFRSAVKRTLSVPVDSGMSLCRPGLRHGASPVRQAGKDRCGLPDRVWRRVTSLINRRRFTEHRSGAWLESVTALVKDLKAQSLSESMQSREDLRRQLLQHKMTDDTLTSALAHACVAAENTLALVPRNNQLLAARAMLQGYFVEMATGEGKTLSIALAAAAAAMSGTPVHVLTANDYLATRDASAMEPVYESLGLQVHSITAALNTAERQQAYKADVVYLTARQIASDWLKDALTQGTRPESLVSRLDSLTIAKAGAIRQPAVRGLCLAIVDEADSLLVDEARVPLVLAVEKSRVADTDVQAVTALGLAEQLRESIDYRVHSGSRFVQLTESGREELLRMSEHISSLWHSARYREDIVSQALTVLHRFERDRDYIVRNGRVELLDVHTGRAMADRRLPHMMHRLLEYKEKCRPSPEHTAEATLPFQNFFRRYLDLVGISGTLREVSGEMQHVYGGLLVHIAPHCRSQRLDIPPLVFNTRADQLCAMVDDVKRRQETGQPVLVCTRSVEQSLEVSAMLNAHGIAHHVLNAYQDAEEAQIVASAGQSSQVTVATNMAGRGTDIPLDEAVGACGGLHVLSLAFNDARRLDRQLAGRVARQGDPGSYQQMLSLDDAFLTEAMPDCLRGLAALCVHRRWHLPVMMLIRWTQLRMERRYKSERLALYQTGQQTERHLAFADERGRYM